MEGLSTWWPLEFDNIALGIRHVQGEPLSFGAEALGNGANFDAVCLEVAANARFVEWVNPKAKMIQIAPLFAWCSATSAAEFAVDRHKINERPASPQLDQAN